MELKGLYIVICGVIGLVLTIIWIIVDIKNKEKREIQLLGKANLNKNLKHNDNLNIKRDKQDKVEDVLYDETEPL